MRALVLLLALLVLPEVPASAAPVDAGTRTSVSTPLTLARGSTTSLCARTRLLERGAAAPAGVLTVTVRRNAGGYAATASGATQDGRVCVDTGRLRRLGGYHVLATYTPAPGLEPSAVVTGFDVVPRRADSDSEGTVSAESSPVEPGATPTTTVIEAPGSVVSGRRVRVCASVTGAGGAPVTGQVFVLVTRNRDLRGRGAVLDLVDGRVCVTDRLRRLGGYTVSAEHLAHSGSGYAPSLGAGGFDVRARSAAR